MTRLTLNAQLPDQQLESIDGQRWSLINRQGLLHLQFRRFAGCPICNLHLHSFLHRHEELAQRGAQCLAIFHASRAALLAEKTDSPVALIADPEKALYRAFGVENAWWSMANPLAWPAALKGLLRHGAGLPERGQSMLGLPADFLIGPGGRLLALHYGRHADDQWSVDQVLQLADDFATSATADV